MQQEAESRFCWVVLMILWVTEAQFNKVQPVQLGMTCSVEKQGFLEQHVHQIITLRSWQDQNLIKDEGLGLELYALRPWCSCFVFIYACGRDAIILLC